MAECIFYSFRPKFSFIFSPRLFRARRCSLIDLCFTFFLSLSLFHPFFRTSIATNNTKQNRVNGYNKENVPSNTHSAVSSAGTSRAILAVSKISVTQKVAGGAVPAPTLKSALKKSISTSATNLNTKNDRPKLVKQNTVVPKAYEYAEIQKKKREELAQKLKEEAEKELKFKFHAKPVPKSVKAPTIQPKVIAKPPLIKQKSLKENEDKKRLLKQLSMPILPVVKRPAPAVPSCGDPDRIKAIEEHRQRLREKYKLENVQFKAKPASVLRKPVFQPKHNFKPAEAKPFKLVLSQRLVQRTAYDKQLQETQTIKKQQEDIVKRHQELQERKQMRQAREFKANPNPFGRGR